MKKYVSLFLAFSMAVFMLAGCTSKPQSSSLSVSSGVNSGSSLSEAPKEIEKIKIYLPCAGSFDDAQAVMEKVNEISREKIGVEVEFKFYQFGQWFQQYSLFISGTEDCDVIANYGGYLNAVSQGAAYELNDLLDKYGKDIVALEGDYIKSGMVNGTQYAIPIYASYAWTMGIIYRQDIVDELGLTEQVAAVKTLEDWEPILKAVKEKKPEIIPFVSNSGNTAATFQYGTWDSLGNNYGVLMNGGAGTKVENLFETEEYANLCKILYDWNKKGYSSKDIQTQTDAFTVMTQNDAAFCTLGQADFNTAFYQSTTCNRPIGVVMLDTPAARTYDNVTYTIMSNTEHPEAAMKFMNLWFSDEEIGNLISYGIEGTHYVLDENGMGSYPEGKDATNCGYHPGSGISNTNRIRWNTESATYAEDLIKSNNNAVKSNAIGFAFNTETVTNEITQLDNVCSKYQIGLECGVLDPDKYLPEFQKALKEAGLEKVIAEKQAQLDAFLAK